jgi:uncharacterized protein YycO
MSAPKDIQAGDIIVTSPLTATGSQPSLLDRLSKKVQGGFTHALMASGDNHVIDVRPELGGVRKRPLAASLRNLDYVVLRPNAPKLLRNRAARVMTGHVGTPYSMQRAALTAAHLTLPSSVTRVLEKVVPHDITKDRGVQCAGAVTGSYSKAGLELHPGKSLTAPVDLLAHPDLKVVHTRIRSGQAQAPILPSLRGRVIAKLRPHVKIADFIRHKGKVAPGDVVLVSPGRQASWTSPTMPIRMRVPLGLAEKVYRGLGPKTLGHFTHAGIIGPSGHVIEALDRVREVPFHKSVADKDYLVLRPNAPASVRRAAAVHAKTQVGTPYSVGAMLAGGANTLLPTKAHIQLSKALVGKKHTSKSWMCGGLVAHSYEKAGLNMEKFPAAPLVTPGHLAASLDSKMVQTKVQNPEGKVRLPTLGVLARSADIKKRYEAAGLKTASVPGLSKEKRRAMGMAHAHLSQEKPDWDRFLQSATRKSFVRAIQSDPRADAKLRRHVDQMSRLQTGKPLGQVPGTEGNHTIVRLRGGGLGCTCNDWRYRKSVAPTGSQDCKHIKEFKAMRDSSQKQASAFYIGIREGSEKVAYGMQLGGAVLGGLSGMRARNKNRYDQNLADYSAVAHGLMSPEEYSTRRKQRRIQQLSDAGVGAVAGGIGGHLFKTHAIPHLQQRLSDAKKGVVELAGEAGRRAVESAKDPARDIAKEVARVVVDEGEDRIKRNLSKVNVGNLAQEAGQGLRKGLTPGWFNRGSGSPGGEGVFSKLKRFIREE